MKKKSLNFIVKNNHGSITIIALFIFLIITTSTTLVLMFATSQAALSRNQLEKIQYEYINEDSLNKLVYDEFNIDKYVKEKIFKVYRTGWKSTDGCYDIIIDKDDPLRENIKKALFKLENIGGRERIVFEIPSKQKQVNKKVIASGPCIKQIFESKQALLVEGTLDSLEEEFLEFMGQIEDENCDYDCKLNANSKKINLNEDTCINFKNITYDYDKLFYKKHIITSKENIEKEILEFGKEVIILNIKSQERNRSLTIGSCEEDELIKFNGVLYVEGDLIIEGNLEFSGLIIINGGDIIVNSINKPKINGMIFFKGDNLDPEKIDLNYDQKAIYKQASFLPGFIDIQIDTIKKY